MLTMNYKGLSYKYSKKKYKTNHENKKYDASKWKDYDEWLKEQKQPNKNSTNKRKRKKNGTP